MEKITELLNNLDDIGKFVPKLDTLMGWVQWLISLAVRLGPLCILVLGIIHLVIPPKEANRKAGFRTYFGMGSVLAWRFTQFASGILMTLTGAVLTLIAYSTVGKFDSMDLLEMATASFDVIKLQVICALIIYILMFLLTAVMFNRNGVCRFGGRANAVLNRLLVREKKKSKYVQKSSVPEITPQELSPVQETEQQYEKQGEQVITADDIVIEGLD